MHQSNSITLFNLPIRNVSMQAAIEDILKALKKESFTSIYFINAHCVNVAYNDQSYQQFLKNNLHNYADGIGMQIASKLFHKPLIDNVNGTDMFPQLFSRLNQQKVRVYLLGGTQKTAAKLAQQIKQKYSNIEVSGSHHGYFQPEENDAIVSKIKDSKADLLLVALGVPKQEKWIAQFGEKTQAKVAMGVGGLFNFYSGNIPRAPVWMRKAGLEWLHRFWMEPNRLWKRYFIGNIIFLCRAVYQRYKGIE